jgi:hypothetical protein
MLSSFTELNEPSWMLAPSLTVEALTIGGWIDFGGGGLMRVVAHVLDGGVLKGESLDVDAGPSVCHITPTRGSRAKVELSQLKSLFIVRSRAGDPRRNDAQLLLGNDARRRPIRTATISGYW